MEKQRNEIRKFRNNTSNFDHFPQLNLFKIKNKKID